MKYYITKAGEDGEMVGPLIMLPPYCPGFDESDPDVINHYNNQELKWQAHLASLPKIKHRLPNKVGDIVSEEDFEWTSCDCKIGQDCPFINGKWFSPCKVAIPKERKELLKEIMHEDERDGLYEQSFTREDMIGFAEAYRPMRQKALDECAGDKQKWIETIDRPTSYWLTKYLTNKKQ